MPILVLRYQSSITVIKYLRQIIYKGGKGLFELMILELQVHSHQPQSLGSLIRLCVMEKTAHIIHYDMRKQKEEGTRVLQPSPGTCDLGFSPLPKCSTASK